MADFLTDEQIENLANMAERAAAVAVLEDCSVSEGMRRLLKLGRLLAQVDAKLADNKKTASMLSGSMPTKIN